MTSRSLIALSLFASTLLGLAAPAQASELEVAYRTGKNIPKPMIMNRFVEYTKARKVPELTFYNTQGEPADFSQYQGKLLMVNIWASWCGPCLKELPALDNVEKAMAGQPFEILPLSIDEEPVADVLARLEKYEIPDMQPWFDRDQRFGKVMPVNAVPATYFFDGEGNLIGFVRDYLDWEDEKMLPFLQKLTDKYAQPKHS